VVNENIIKQRKKCEENNAEIYENMAHDEYDTENNYSVVSLPRNCQNSSGEGLIF
jgi:hypothetical protein